MLGVIYSISILIMIVATALGYQKGMMIWKNFAKGLLTFEFIKIALVIVNSTVNQYAASHAADFLASVGQNPASLSSLPYYINYTASMTGVAGMLGIAAIFMIPEMVFSGEVAMAAGAIGGLASKYKGNDIQTATSESAQQKSQNAAWENELKDQARLDHMGVSVPQGMGATQFYSDYQKGAQMANAGYGAARMGTGAMDSAGHAAKGQTMQNISAMSTLNQNATMDDFVSAGVGQGAMMAGDVTGTAHAVNSYGDSAVDKIKAGKSSMTAKSIGNTVGYGEEVDNDSAIAFGELGGKTMGATDRGTYEGAVTGGIGNFLKGSENQAAKKSSTTASYGKETNLKSAIDAGKFTGIEMGSADNRLASDPNLEGDARTSGTMGIDKKLQSIHGAQKAQIYNKDGSDSKEHDKFMLGAEELSRQALNAKELTMGLAMKGKSEEEKRQMYADTQAAGSIKTLDEFSKSKGARKTGSFTHDKDGYLETASNENDVSWKDTNGKTHRMSRAKANEILADSEQRGIVGKGAGISSQTHGGKNMDVLANNAMGMEAGNISGMSAAIDTAGGVKAFAALKATQSSIQTAESSGASKGKVEEGLIKGGMGKEDAKKLADAIVNGSTEGADKFKKALESLGSVAGTKAGGQTRADMASIATAGGNEGFKELQSDTANIKTAQSLKSVDAAKNAGFMDESGNITEKGMKAYGITPGEQASALSGKLNIGSSIGSSLQKLKDNQFKIQKGLGKTSEEAEKNAEALVAPFRDKEGNFLEGQAFWNKQAELKSGVFSGSNSMLLGDGHIFGGAISHNGMTGRISSGLNTSVNNQYDEKAGKKLDAGVEGEIQKNISGAENAERARFAMNPKKWVEGIAAKGHDVGVESLKKLGFNDKEAEEMYSAVASPSVGVAGSVAIAEVASRISGRGSFVGKVKDAGVNLFKPKNPIPDKTIDSSRNIDNPRPDGEVNNKGQHNDSFNKNIPNDTTSGKKVNSNLDFENMSVDGEEIITKQPAPHMSNVKGSTLSRFIKGVGEVAGPLAAGYEINKGFQDVASGRKDVAQSVADTGNRLINDFSFGFADPVREAIKGDLTPMKNQINAPTDIMSQGMSYVAAAAMMPFSDNSFSQNQQAVYSSLKTPSFNSHRASTGHSIVPPAPQQNITGGGGSSDDVFNQSAFMQNMQSRVTMGSFQSLKASQISLRSIGMAEETRENINDNNESFQDQLSDIIFSLEESKNAYL